MPELTLIATSAFGLESVVSRELKVLGYKDPEVSDGKIKFSGDYRDIAKCNIWLRCADRLLIEIAEFKAEDFDELFDNTRAIEWGKIIPGNGEMYVTGKSVRSKLFSVSACQSTVKKAVIEAMKREYNKNFFSEDGPLYRIEVALLKDTATLTIDTSGDGLHKRGYAEKRGEAPLRETMAAALVLLSKWDPSRVFVDPLCGTGTIPIEAAMIGRNIAPGINRSFAAEQWPGIPKKIWKSVREEAQEAINNRALEIHASDMDEKVFRLARENARKAGVEDSITFQKKPLEEFSSKKKYGCVVCNPPYGERLGDKDSVEKLYKTMGQIFSKLDTWSFFILTAHSGFQKHFGRKADKNRKLYNGRLQCYLYQYLGPSQKKNKITPFLSEHDSAGRSDRRIKGFQD